MGDGAEEIPAFLALVFVCVVARRWIGRYHGFKLAGWSATNACLCGRRARSRSMHYDCMDIGGQFCGFRGHTRLAYIAGLALLLSVCPWSGAASLHNAKDKDII